MIHYNLRCDSAHEFDGWFKDSQNFERQVEDGLVSCPVCSATKIERALMAPNLPKKINTRSAIVPADLPAGQEAPVQSAGGMIPDAVRAALLKLRAEVEKNCDYVGDDFAKEIRKIHNGEADPRGIYGETTPSQAEALADEGIEFASIPWLPRADS